MIARFASVYVRSILVIELLVLGFAVLLHVSVLMGAEKAFDAFGKPLLYCAFAITIPAVGLAKERNVWKNEFKNCPKWLRIATVILTVYGGLVASAQVMFFSDGGAFDSQPLFASAVPLFLGPVPLCIPHSLLWASPVTGAELMKRVRISLIASAIFLATVVAAHLGYLPHQCRH
jgi:hypothetical protein